MTCRHCGTRFVVYREDPSLRELARSRGRVSEEEVTAPAGDGAETTPTEPIPARLTPLRVWIFPDDPAMQHKDVLPCLKTVLAHDHVQLLSEDFRRVVCEHFWPPLEDATPHVVLFGETHVQLRDPLLQRVATKFGVHRVLVSLDPSEAPLRATRGFCGVDSRLTVPLDPARVAEAIVPGAPR